MLSASEWRKNQENMVTFVLVDGDGLEVTGLGSSFDLSLAKAGGPFIDGTGDKAEMGFGWYSYLTTAEEANTSGPVSIVVSGVTTIQQNLEYVVDDRVVSAIDFTYTVTSTAGNVPLAGVEVAVYADSLMTQIVWNGFTDVFGVARDFYDQLPRLMPGTYFFFRGKSGYSFSNPDQETVS